mgnify:CR=1 FL=1
MKIDLTISDVEEICEILLYNCQEEQEKYYNLHDELAGHCDEYDPVKEHELYMSFYKSEKYWHRYHHWKDILDDMKEKESSRE